MNKFYIFAFTLVGCCAAHCAATAHDPQSTLLSKLNSGDTLVKMALDLNGDGKQDLLFTVQEANPEPFEVQANAQEAGRVNWDVYICSAAGTSYSESLGIDEGQGVMQTATLPVNPDKMYAGIVSEIGRYGVVTLAVKRSRSENSRVIYAYT